MGRVFQQKNSARWWIGYYAKGPDGRAKEIRESSGSTKRSDALALLRKRTGQISAGSFIEPVVQKTTRVSAILSDWCGTTTPSTGSARRLR